ncbi:MAG: DUF4097 domain-containing protein, partial [Defluviitaleaceae bacterium]|nr:DUF4097 domain-containing protein [Defluviitaleaceae bacterium]
MEKIDNNGAAVPETAAENENNEENFFEEERETPIMPRKKRKAPRNFAFLGVALIIIGAALFGAGFLGGSRGGEIIFNRDGMHILSVSKNGRPADTVSVKANEPIKTVNVNVSSLNVFLRPSDHYGFEIYAPESYGVKWSLEDGALVITSEPEKFSAFSLVMFRGDHYRIEIFYPAELLVSGFDALASADIKTSSGNVTISSLRVKDIKVAASSGNIKVDSLFVGNASFKALSGNIVFEGAADYAGRYAVFSTSSGNINVNMFSGTAIASAQSGNINIRGSLSEVKATTGSGNITFRGSIVTADVKATSGNVK